jgi:formylglycine-generating enzyme required for sulfatase activity
MLRAIALLAGMASIPGGTYRPLYAASGSPTVHVAAFRIDRELVTRRDFERFTRDHPAWRRDRIAPVFADEEYLADWTVGSASEANQPATRVSWFAARAYCAAVGKRLPTTDEWEYVAAASETRRDATSDPAFLQRLAILDASQSATDSHRGFRNVHGVAGLHGVVWEWTFDFNRGVASDDSRASGSGIDARDRHLYCASAAIGAADPTNYAAFLREAVRSGLSGRTTLDGLGFRCAASLAS